LHADVDGAPGCGGRRTGMKRARVGEDAGDAPAGDVLGEIIPVRTGVGDHAERTALGGVEAPVEIGVAGAAIPASSGPARCAPFAELAAGDEGARVLEHDVVADVEGDGVDDAGATGGGEHALRLDGSERHRLVDDDVFAGAGGGEGDRACRAVGVATSTTSIPGSATSSRQSPVVGPPNVLLGRARARRRSWWRGR
jgi:hypothetical protein